MLIVFSMSAASVVTSSSSSPSPFYSSSPWSPTPLLETSRKKEPGKRNHSPKYRVFMDSKQINYDVGRVFYPQRHSENPDNPRQNLEYSWMAYPVQNPVVGPLTYLQQDLESLEKGLKTYGSRSPAKGQIKYLKPNQERNNNLNSRKLPSYERVPALTAKEEEILKVGHFVFKTITLHYNIEFRSSNL